MIEMVPFTRELEDKCNDCLNHVSFVITTNPLEGPYSMIQSEQDWKTFLELVAGKEQALKVVAYFGEVVNRWCDDVRIRELDVQIPAAIDTLLIDLNTFKGLWKKVLEDLSIGKLPEAEQASKLKVIGKNLWECVYFLEEQT